MSVHNLQSNTVYKFMVLSRNRLGDGLFSATVTATTKGCRFVTYVYCLTA